MKSILIKKQKHLECLIEILEDGTIKPEELKDYGMDY
jgi:hypothetical protein